MSTRGVLLSLAICLCASSALIGQASPSETPVLKIQNGHSANVKSAVFSRDGRFALSASDDYTVALWDVASGKELRKFSGHTQYVYSAAFSPDCKQAISGSGDRSCILWDVETGAKLKVFRGHMEGVSSVAFSPDGKRFVSASFDKDLKLWDLATGKEILTLPKNRRQAEMRNEYAGHREPVTSVAFSPDGQFVLSGSDDGTMKLWDAWSGDELITYAAGSSPVASVAVSPDGARALSASADGAVRLWDLGKGKAIRALGGGSKGATAVAFSPDGDSCLASYNDTSIKLWNLSNGALRKSMGVDSTITYSVAFSPDGKSALTGSSDKMLHLWDLASGRDQNRFSPQADGIRAVAISPDGGRAFTCGEMDRNVRCWDLKSGKLLRTYKGNQAFATSVAVSPDGKRVFSGAYHLVKAWDADTGAVFREYQAAGMISSIALSPDGKTLIGGSLDANTEFWDVESGKEIGSLRGSVSRFALSPDGRRLAVVSLGSLQVKLIDIASGKKVLDLVGHSGDIMALAFSPYGDFIATGSNDDTVRLWSAASGKELWSVKGPATMISSVAFTPDGNRLLVGDTDGAIRLREVETGKEIRSYLGHAHFVMALAFSPDGKYFVSGSYDLSLKLWDLESGRCIYTALSNADGSKWLVFNPEGYWDGSANCSDLVAMVKGVEYWNIDQFAARDNRPDLVLGGIAGNEGLREGLRQEYLKRLRKLGIVDAQGRPDEARLSSGNDVPEARILSVKQEGNIAKIDFALVDPKYPLDRYSVFVNDVPLFGSRGKKSQAAAGRKLELSETVELTAGDNKIEVACWNQNQAESLRAAAELAYAPKTAPKGELWFLGFGVTEYADPRIPKLGYTVKDAQDLARVFGKMKGGAFADVHVKLLLEKEVSVEGIRGAKAFLKDAKPEDSFVLFISGHGIHDGDPAATYYYITQGADMSDLKGTAADFDDVEDLLQGVAPRRKLFLMDTCASGNLEDSAQSQSSAFAGSRGIAARAIPAGSRGLAVKGAARTWLQAKDRYIFNDLVRRSGAIVFSSCRGGEYSYEGGAVQNGFFTAAVIKALTTKEADADGNKSVTSDELRDYVSKAVALMSVDPKDFPEGAQHPTVDRDNLTVKLSFPIVGAK